MANKCTIAEEGKYTESMELNNYSLKRLYGKGKYLSTDNTKTRK